MAIFNNNKGLQPKGMVLVMVLIFLLAISVLSVSSISSAKLQLTLLNNQQTYLQAIAQLANVKQLVFSQLKGDIYSEQILNLDSVLAADNKLHDSNTFAERCDMSSVNNWLVLDLMVSFELTYNLSANQFSNLNSEFSELTKALKINNVKTYLSMISIELIDSDDDSMGISLSSKRLETLIIKQCLALNNSDLWLLETSIITRRGIDRFNISSISSNTEIKLAGSG